MSLNQELEKNEYSNPGTKKEIWIFTPDSNLEFPSFEFSQNIQTLFHPVYLELITLIIKISKKTI